MKIRVHYTIYGNEDSFVVEGEEYPDAQKEVKEEISRRGMNLQRNDIWTEVVVLDSEG